jgi:ABC-2 type transport system permease protein
VDEDPFGALYGLVADRAGRSERGPDRVVLIADRRQLEWPRGRASGRDGPRGSGQLYSRHRHRLGQLAICVLGALVMTTEYSTGVIRASLLAVPRRIPMLAAKGAVFAALILVVSEIVTFGSYLVGSAMLHSHVPVSLSDPGVLRAVIGTGLSLTLLGLFAMAIGTLIRHTAGAITTVIGIVLVLPILSGLLPGSWGAHINAYLPEQAGGLITQAHRHAGDLLTPWQGFGVFCIWTAVLLVAAAYLLRRRDA